MYRVLSSLQRKEFLYEQPAFSEVEYIFKHALTQEVAYSTVLQERRKALHERTAQAMEALYHANLDDHYSDVAHHYQRSSNTEKAIEYLHLAGQQAVQRSANVEAITHLTTALELLNTLPDTRERAQQELTLLLTLGVPLQAARSVSSPEVQATYNRAGELCQQVGETTPVLPDPVWTADVSSCGRRASHGARAGGAAPGLGPAGARPGLAHGDTLELGTTFFHLGEFSAAWAHLEPCLTFYEAQRRHFHVFPYGSLAPGVVGLS